MFFRACLTASAAMLAIYPVSASAQESPAPVTTGLRVVGLIGYDDTAFDSVVRGNGLFYGVGLGYDLGHRRLRFGIEAEAADSTARNCVSTTAAPGNICLTASRDLYVGARVGVQVDPGVLLYGKAGYTNFRESNQYPASLGGIVTHPTSDGLRLGLGTELSVGRRSFVTAEYRYSSYEQSQDFDRHQAVLGFGFRF
jgi:outer membrane immunogenic protein